MLLGFYSGVSGIYHNEQRLAVVSNNAANAQTNSFRRSYLALRTRQEHSDTARVDHKVQERNPDFYGVQVAGIYQNHTQTGQIRHTDNKMDVAIAPELTNAFFPVKRAGSNETFYTRNGKLSLAPLDPNDPTSPNTLKISGHTAIDAAGAPIEIDSSGGELSITQDGQIHQGEATVGELPLYRFNNSADPTRQAAANLQLLEKQGDSIYKIPEKHKDEIVPFRIEVGKAGVSRLMSQGDIEGSNVNIMQEMTELMQITRASQANETAISHHTQALNKLFRVVRS